MSESSLYLREVIDSLRHVDRLITREKDPARLIRRACGILSGMGAYVYSWIIITDDAGSILDSAESGIGEDFHNLEDMALETGLPPCVKKSLARPGLVFNRVDEPCCSSCRLKEGRYCGLESCVARLEHDGEVFGVMAAGFPSEQVVDDTQKGLFLEIAEDIAYALHVMRMENEREESRRILEKSLRKTESLLKTMPDMMFVLGRDGGYLEYWAEDDRALAIPPDRIIGSSVSELDLSDDKLEEVMNCISETLGTDEVRTVEYELDLEAGHRYYEARLAPYGEDSVIAVVRDITARREAENRRRELEARVQHTQKLESLGVLAGGIAHDFNNILMTILGNADLAMLALPESSPANGFLEEIAGAASKASDLARQMLAYSGKSDFRVRPVDLNEIIIDLTHMLEVTISKKVVLKFRMEESLPAAMADATQMRQIIMNLMTNASEAMGESSGYICVTTGAMYCDRDYLLSTELADRIDEGMYVYFEVADTGCGMDAAVKSQLFEPFFTTKGTGRGLGLSSALGIVRAHGGAVKVYSEPGEGTTFKILLPACSEKELEDLSCDDLPAAAKWRGEGTVLFADDEDTVLAVGRRMLEYLGFSVLTASDGRKAVEVFSENMKGIDLVILDLTMPGLSGDEVYREIRRLRKDVPVIVSSGFSRRDVMHRFAGKRLNGFIQKPYRAEDLSELIREVLETGTDGSEETEQPPGHGGDRQGKDGPDPPFPLDDGE